MKYLGTYNESNRFLNLKEVLNYTKELSSDFTDEGFETIFGIMPHALSVPGYANFDENLDDIQIKKASLGRVVIYLKFDLKNIKDQDFSGKLNNSELNLLLRDYTSIYKYLESERMVIYGLWTKTFRLTGRNSPGLRSITFEKFDTLEDLSNNIIDTNSSEHSFVQDVRISFTAERLLDE